MTIRTMRDLEKDGPPSDLEALADGAAALAEANDQRVEELRKRVETLEGTVMRQEALLESFARLAADLTNRMAVVLMEVRKE